MTSTTASSHGPSVPRISPRRIYQILAGRMFDSINRRILENQIITIDAVSGIILDVSPDSEAARVQALISDFSMAVDHQSEGDGNQSLQRFEISVLDFSNLTILPGLVDAHVHLFLHPYKETSWDDQTTKESLAERTARATIHARRTLLAGFTTVRDLGTEGAFDADIGLRTCLSGRNPVIPGPRYYCSTRAIISTGSYGPRSSLYPTLDGVEGVIGAQPVDGIDQCVKEVRRQIGAGADWIKIYGDYRNRARQVDASPALALKSRATFNNEELSAMIATANARGVKAAAHASTFPVISNLIDLGINSIEHAHELYDSSKNDASLIQKIVERNSGTGSKTMWVPTLGVYYTSFLDAGGDEARGAIGAYIKDVWRRCQESFHEVVTNHPEMDDWIAAGGDTGVFAHGENALELVLMRKLGAGWEKILSWATYGGWRCVRGLEWEGKEGQQRVESWERKIGSFVNKRTKVEEEAGVDSERPLTLELPDAVGLERDVPFGVIRAGWVADIVGVEGKLEGSVQDFEEALTKGVKFVMKGGKVYKLEGLEVFS